MSRSTTAPSAPIVTRACPTRNEVIAQTPERNEIFGLSHHEILHMVGTERCLVQREQRTVLNRPRGATHLVSLSATTSSFSDSFISYKVEIKPTRANGGDLYTNSTSTRLSIAKLNISWCGRDLPPLSHGHNIKEWKTRSRHLTIPIARHAT